MIKDYPEELKAFVQHGFKPTTKSGPDNFIGNCIFCSKADKFYVNAKTKAWDCKVCMEHGGYQVWLQKVQAFTEKNFTGKPALDLCSDRGLSLSTMRRNKIGYNPVTREEVIPIWDMNHQNIWDLRFRRQKKMWSTFGNSVGLYGWDKLLQPFKTVWICEGEWDGLALDEIFFKMKMGPDVVWVAVPGAGTFKAEWTAMFKDKNVVCAYDHDKAGKLGTIKVYNQLKPLAADLKFVHWPEGTADGWDLRDLYTKEHKGDATAAMKALAGMLKPEPTGAQEVAQAAAKDGKPAPAGAAPRVEVVKLDGEGMQPEDVYAAYQKYLHLPDTRVLDFMFGVVLANRAPGDPIWGQLMGPSGATKTELLITLDDAPYITTASSLTPHSLVSGANFSGGGDPSLIPRWDGKVVIIKDLTVLLSLNQTYREEIFSILRDAYDGKTERSFGNGILRSYKSRFGMLCGVTPAIELFTEEHTALGERFLRFPVVVPNDFKGRMDISRRAMQNTTNEDQLRSALRDVGKKVLNHKYTTTPSVGTAMEEKILNLAQFTALMRSTIKRDNFTKEITHKPFGELGTRLTKQFYKLMVHGIGTFRRVKDLGEAEYSTIRRISLGTVPSRMEEVVRRHYLKDPQAAYTIKEYTDLLGLPSSTTQRLVDGLQALGVLKRATKTTRPEWTMTKDIIGVIETADLYKEEK